jgi:hypothetical protein
MRRRLRMGLREDAAPAVEIDGIGLRDVTTANRPAAPDASAKHVFDGLRQRSVHNLIVSSSSVSALSVHPYQATTTAS